MSNASYQSPGGQWRPFEPVAPAPRTRRPLTPALLPAILLMVAGVLTIVSSFLTMTQTTDRLLANSYFGSDPNAKIEVTTTTAWSVTFSLPAPHQVQPHEGWGFVLVGAVALVVAVLLLTSHGRWVWTKPLAALASGLLAGVILLSVLGFADSMSADFTDKTESVHTSAGPAIWLQIPAGLLAIVVAVLAMSSGRGRLAANIAPPANTPMPLPPNPHPQAYYAPPPTPYPPQQQPPNPPIATPPDA